MEAPVGIMNFDKAYIYPTATASLHGDFRLPTGLAVGCGRQRMKARVNAIDGDAVLSSIEQQRRHEQVLIRPR